MSYKRTKRPGRLRQLAAGLAAAAAAIIPGVAAASAGSPAGVEVEALATRFTRAENALERAAARTDAATLRVFACDCAARVVPLCERFVASADLLERARTDAVAADEVRASRSPQLADPLDAAIARFEADVRAFEREVACEATVGCSARSALARVVFARSAERVARLESGAANDNAESGPPFRMLAVAIPAARAIDEALLIAAGGSLARLGPMWESIAEAVYLDHAFRTRERARAIRAVLRELAWQRAHLRALRSS
jgi:hypothetical protein